LRFVGCVFKEMMMMMMMMVVNVYDAGGLW